MPTSVVIITKLWMFPWQTWSFAKPTLPLDTKECNLFNSTKNQQGGCFQPINTHTRKGFPKIFLIYTGKGKARFSSWEQKIDKFVQEILCTSLTERVNQAWEQLSRAHQWRTLLLQHLTFLSVFSLGCWLCQSALLTFFWFICCRLQKTLPLRMHALCSKIYLKYFSA